MEEISVICRNEDETVAFAQKLSQIAKAGDTFALFGTLGMGKSVLPAVFCQVIFSQKIVFIVLACGCAPAHIARVR